jgi:hypothetical protein
MPTAFRGGMARAGPKSERGRPTGGLVDSHFNIRRFVPAGRGLLQPLDRQNRKRRPAVGAQLLKTWKPFAWPPATAEYMKPA